MKATICSCSDVSLLSTALQLLPVSQVNAGVAPCRLQGVLFCSFSCLQRSSERVHAGQQKHVSRAMVEAWCNAAKANASPAAMHKLLQVHLCRPHVIFTAHCSHCTLIAQSALALPVRFLSGNALFGCAVLAGL